MSYNPTNPRPLATDNKMVRSAYSPRVKVSITFPAQSPVTKQEFRDECDVNRIMARHLATGQMPVMNQRAPQYLDVSGIDFQQSMEFVAGAKTLFNELPSAIRNRFKNDPAEFLDFCSQEKNRPEMAEMGLLKPQAEWVVNPDKIVPPAPAPAVPVPNPSPAPAPAASE